MGLTRYLPPVPTAGRWHEDPRQLYGFRQLVSRHQKRVRGRPGRSAPGQPWRPFRRVEVRLVLRCRGGVPSRTVQSVVGPTTEAPDSTRMAISSGLPVSLDLWPEDLHGEGEQIAGAPFCVLTGEGFRLGVIAATQNTVRG